MCSAVRTHAYAISFATSTPCAGAVTRQHQPRRACRDDPLWRTTSDDIGLRQPKPWEDEGEEDDDAEEPPPRPTRASRSNGRRGAPRDFQEAAPNRNNSSRLAACLQVADNPPSSHARRGEEARSGGDGALRPPLSAAYVAVRRDDGAALVTLSGRAQRARAALVKVSSVCVRIWREIGAPLGKDAEIATRRRWCGMAFLCVLSGVLHPNLQRAPPT